MKKLLVFLLVFLSVASFGFEETFKGKNYVAKVSERGINSLLINGVEFVHPVGSFFVLNKEIYEKNYEAKRDGDKLFIKSDVGSLVIDFMPERIDLTVTNISAINYFMLMDDNVLPMDQKILHHPWGFKQDNEVKLFKDSQSLTVRGNLFYWGPWRRHSLIDYKFDGKAGKINWALIPAPMTEKEKREKYAKPDFDLYSPVNYEVFQRETKTKGKMLFSARVPKNVTDLKYKIEGKDINEEPVDTGFAKLKTDEYGMVKQSVPCNAGGWYKVTLKYKVNGKEKEQVIENVGIGEVIIGAGQSNSTNCGEVKTKTRTGMVATTDGVKWALGNDPMMGVHDRTTKGSFWPAMGDALYNEFKVPIGLVSAGWAGTVIEEWMKDTTFERDLTVNCYNYFINRVNHFGPNGFRCVIWHQGESGTDNVPNITYILNRELIETSRIDAGWYIPWFVAKVSYHSPEIPKHDNIRQMHQKLWDDGVAFPGPDTDTLGSEYRDIQGKGVHFNAKGLKKHGEMWAECLIPYIHSKTDK